MLVIQRRVGESILIGDDVELTLMQITPSRIKLGIVAPRQVAVIRKEAQEARTQNLLASGPAQEAPVAALASFLRAHPPDPSDN